jgi:hypothetical protein
MTLWSRDAISEIKAAPSTFTSWDKCMAKTYCKYVVSERRGAEPLDFFSES